MSDQITCSAAGARLSRRLTSVYTQTAAWYLLIVFILWQLGFEAIYGHPTPFYGQWMPVSRLFTPLALLCVALWALWRRRCARLGQCDVAREGWRPWVGPVLAVAAAVLGDLVFRGGINAHDFILSTVLLAGHIPAALIGYVGITRMLKFAGRIGFGDPVLSRRTTAWFLAGCVLFAFVFAGGVALMRGPQGITGTYDRGQLEYPHDIGVGGSIPGLFRDYERMHPHLSVHSKVYPPGPIALLWVMSWIVGRGSLGLSLATMLVGSLGVIPLYLWVREVMGTLTAVVTSFLYLFIPSIVMFTATSASIMFVPFVVATVLTFWRAIHRPAMPHALAAGALYAACSLLSFSLLTLGALFACVGLWRIFTAPGDGRRQALATVTVTAAVMLAGFLGVHLALRLWTGFDYIAAFHLAKAQFDADQAGLDIHAPRAPWWAWKVLNPAATFYFAGIPVSTLFLMRILRLPRPGREAIVTCAVTAAVLSLLYLARGEGERSALYIMPFIVVPAGHMLSEFTLRVRDWRPLRATLVFLAVQTWLTESHLYTYW